MNFSVKDVLYAAAYFPKEIERVLDKKNPTFLKFDPVLGYLMNNHQFRDGMDKTMSDYNFETKGGHRRMINYADKPCRINTYGNSYTQCAQVSDGETWQETLAAHFREPIRNFGVGGYGVYQAYRRLMSTEQNKNLAVNNIILNIWDDDHFRNIDAARWIRVGWIFKEMPRGGGPETYPVHGFPWAHIRYDLKMRKFVELDGYCKKPEDLRNLVGKDNYYNVFKEDLIAHIFTLRNGGEAGDVQIAEMEQLAEEFGIKVNLRNKNTRVNDAKKLHTAYSLRSTMYILDNFSKWAKSNKRKLIILLSYDVPSVKTYLEKTTRFDQDILSYLEKNDITYVDCLKKSKEDYQDYKININKYLEKLYVGRAGAQVFGHYNPYGNFWFAHAIRPEILKWLNPKPSPYI